MPQLWHNELEDLELWHVAETQGRGANGASKIGRRWQLFDEYFRNETAWTRLGIGRFVHGTGRVHRAVLDWRQKKRRGRKTFRMVAVDVCKDENQGPELHIKWGRCERPFFFLRQIFLALIFFCKIAIWSNFPENRLTRLLSSTIRTVIDGQFVREKLSIALLF